MVTVKGDLVEFSFFRPQAQQVHLVGDFNQWQKEQTPMSRQSDGYWRTRLHLPSGEFMFRYCADGEWLHRLRRLRRAGRAPGSEQRGARRGHREARQARFPRVRGLRAR